jgi:hypothetical protein
MVTVVKQLCFSLLGGERGGCGDGERLNSQLPTPNPNLLMVGGGGGGGQPGGGGGARGLAPSRFSSIPSSWGGRGGGDMGKRVTVENLCRVVYLVSPVLIRKKRGEK